MEDRREEGREKSNPLPSSLPSLPLSGQDLIDAGADIAQVGCIAAAEFGGHVASIADVGKGAPHLRPVDTAVAQIGPISLNPSEQSRSAFEVLQMHLLDAAAQSPDPVFGPG